MSSKFFTQRFYLDTPLARAKNRGGEHYVGPFKSFWVSDASDSNFQAQLIIDPRDDAGSGLPLRLNQCQSLEEKALEACVESSVAQPGAWIDITFAQDDKMDVGSVSISVNGKVAIDEGSLSPQSKVTVTSVAAQILDSDDERKIARFQYKSGVGKVYVGSQAELADPDFANICHHVDAGDDFELSGSGAHYAKSVGGDVVFSLRKGMN